MFTSQCGSSTSSFPNRRIRTLQSQDIPLDDIVVLDLSVGTLQTPFPDRKDLPKDPASTLESDLRTAYSHVAPNAIRGAFLRFFLSLFGWYRRFIRFDQNGHVAGAQSPFGGPSSTCHLWFDHRTFVESVRDRKTAGFLDAFQGSQMYEAFVREVLARAAQCRSGEDPFSTEVSLSRTRTHFRFPPSNCGPKHCLCSLQARVELAYSSEPSSCKFGVKPMSVIRTRANSVLVQREDPQRAHTEVRRNIRRCLAWQISTVFARRKTMQNRLGLAF